MFFCNLILVLKFNNSNIILDHHFKSFIRYTFAVYPNLTFKQFTFYNG